MKFDLNRHEIIEAYLKGELSAARQEEFEAFMASDQRVADEVLQYQQLLSAFNQLKKEQYQDQFDDWDTQIDKKKKRFVRIKWSVPIAAGLALFIGLNTISNNNPSALSEQLFEPYPNVIAPITRNTSSDDISVFMFHYENGDYEKVIELYENETPKRNYWNFYGGIAYLATNELPKAIASFEKIDSNDNFFEQSQWYLSLAYVKHKKEEKARKLLIHIIKNRQYQFQQAELLLKDL